MKNYLNIFLKALGYALIGLIFVNIIYFLIEFNSIDKAQNWNFVYKYGQFSINDKPVGLKIFSPKANGFMLIIFLLALMPELKKKRN